jgi:hypothetical protein
MVRAKAAMMVVGVVIFASACAEPPEADAPSLEDDGVEPLQTVTSVNADGTWVADASFINQTVNNIYAGASFTGPSGKTRRMGVCALKQFQENNPVACATVADCNSAPSSLPAGGFRYCVAPNNVGQKYCFYRPGSPASYCAGSPAQAGNPPIAPGTYYTPSTAGSGCWISYACFEGCATTDPSSSTGGLSVQVSPSYFSGNASSFTAVGISTTPLGGYGGYTYQWTQTGGTPYQIAISGPTSPNPTIYRSVSPPPGTYTFRVTVTDSQGQGAQQNVTVQLY